MVNPEKVVEFQTSDAKIWKLYFGNYALRSFELEAGKSAVNVLQNGEIGFQEITMLIQAGLEQFHPELTIRDVDELIDDIGIQNLMTMCKDALGKAFPKAGNVPLVQNGTQATIGEQA